MTEDEKLAIEESNRVAQHEAVKSDIRREMNDEVAQKARRLKPEHDSATTEVGEALREKALTDLTKTESELEKARVAARVSQVVDYIFFLIYGLIGLEILLELLGARDGSGFKAFVDALTRPLLGPFRQLVPDVTAGRFQLKIAYLVALLVYFLLHQAINGLLRLAVHRKRAV
ncbi:MAG TPA: YggT family protein [Blastocatellia bacterium]|nr:YggT family protein [Blastocatellia bacterium]